MVLGKCENIRRNVCSERLVGQLLIVVIDALRADFVFGSEELSGVKADLVKRSEDGAEESPKIRSIKLFIDKGLAEAMLTHVHAPTVTLPKIKTIVTGSIPGMGDFINNFFADETTTDSLITRWRQADRTLTMYGDDTWLRYSIHLIISPLFQFL